MRDLHEELAAIVEEVVASGKQAGRRWDQPPVQVLEIAVVSDINRGSGMNEISDKKVGVEALRW